MTPSTFSGLLDDQVLRSGSRPLVTYYDDATGERVELSVVTFANWVAKTAGVIQDELGLERGDRVLIDLPTHWLAPVWLGASWSTGLAVTTDPAADVSLVVCGPAGVDRYDAADCPVVALSLLPMGRRFTDPLPQGFVDFGVTVWGQPDAFLAYDAPGPQDLAWAGTADRTQTELLTAARTGPWSTPGTRLVTDLAPTSEPGLNAFLGPLLGGGGTVWVTNPDPDGWDHRVETEQATAVHRSGPAQPAKS